MTQLTLLAEVKGRHYTNSDNVYRLSSFPEDPRFLPFEDRGLTAFLGALYKDPDFIKEKVSELERMWRPPKMSGFVRNWNDCPWLDSRFLVFSERAVDALRDELKACGTLLPLKRWQSKRYFLFLITSVGRELNNPMSVYIEKPWLENAQFKRYVFKTDPKRPIFIVPESPTQPLVTSAFVKKVVEAELSGFYFEMVSPLPTSVNWLNLSLRRMRSHLRDGVPAGQSIDGRRVTVEFLLSNENRLATKKEEKQVQRVVKELRKELYEPGEMGIPVGWLNWVSSEAGMIALVLTGPEADKLIAVVQSKLRLAEWTGKIVLRKKVRS